MEYLGIMCKVCHKVNESILQLGKNYKPKFKSPKKRMVEHIKSVTEVDDFDRNVVIEQY